MCVKRERSPTPPLSSKRLVTSGSVHVTDMPISCKQGQPGYEHERRVWVKSETQKLRDIGLSVAKVHVRGDGIAMDWTSSVPVWSDTLLSDTLVPLSGDISNDPDVDTAQPPTEATLQRVGVGIVANDFSSGPEVRSTTTEDSPDAVNRADELEDAALEYIQRYATAFDTDRTGLAGAYAKDAIFSCSVIYDSPSTQRYNDVSKTFVPQTISRNLLIKSTSKNAILGRTAIASALQHFGPHRLIPESVSSPEVEYNMLYIKQLEVVLLTCDGVLVAENDTETRNLRFSMAYLLRDSKSGEREASDWWPLEATNHQFTIWVGDESL